jgi:hypothetical protein
MSKAPSGRQASWRYPHLIRTDALKHTLEATEKRPRTQTLIMLVEIVMTLLIFAVMAGLMLLIMPNAS